MLTNLHVKNLALIEEADIDFTEGLNILTGETGAGKSIIIGSINYCLGAKAGSDVIRNGADYGLTELTFHVDEKMAAFLRDKEYPVEEDGCIILSRKIMGSKSVFKINGESFTAHQAKTLASYLIDIHGQHEHQSLLSESRQKELLDAFSPEEIISLKKEILDIWTEYKSNQQEIEDFSLDNQGRERQIALIRYELEEIEEAALKEGEEEELNRRYLVMKNSKRITEGLSRALELLGQDSDGALSSVGLAVRSLSGIEAFDDRLGNLSLELGDAEQVLTEIFREIRNYREEFDFSEEEFDETEKRLDLINRLQLKYGNSISEILKYEEDQKLELEKLTDGENYLNKLKSRSLKLEKEYDRLADEIHRLREDAAGKLSADIEEALKELNFLKVTFNIEVKEKQSMLSDGRDEISFLISLNPGEALKPLSQVASGGELSRIMLALKEILSKRDNINTLIFDEIDAGISGVTAWQVSKKMGKISRDRQVICITHLPQIAAMAKAHFKIEKSEREGKTVTDIHLLDKEGRAYEIARLLGGETISETVLANAYELMDNAAKVF